MADARSRRTGEHSPQLIKLTLDLAAMREQIDALEGRVLRLESELATARANAASAPAAPAVPRPTSRRPAPLGPPPLPVMKAAMPSIPARRVGRRSIVDISEIAELVESIPPPPRTPRK